MLEGNLPISQITGELPVSQVPTIPNSKLENSSVTINGSAVALGGSTTIATGGTNSPNFSVSGAGQSIPNATWTKVNASSVNFNNGNAYDNTTNYRFTAPENGIYCFSAGVNFNGLGDNVSYGIRFYVDGSSTNLGLSLIHI